MYAQLYVFIITKLSNTTTLHFISSVFSLSSFVCAFYICLQNKKKKIIMYGFFSFKLWMDVLKVYSEVGIEGKNVCLEWMSCIKEAANKYMTHILFLFLQPIRC